jgi:hypothetical protein
VPATSEISGRIRLGDEADEDCDCLIPNSVAVEIYASHADEDMDLSAAEMEV